MSIPPDTQVNATFTETEQSYVVPPTHTLTHDTEARGHIISDDQLMQLAHGGRDVSLEVALAGLGIAAGFVQNLAFSVSAIIGGRVPSIWDAIGAAIFFVAASVSTVTLLYFIRNRTGVSSIVAAIKDRPVGHMMPTMAPYTGGEPVVGLGETTDDD